MFLLHTTDITNEDNFRQCSIEVTLEKIIISYYETNTKIIIPMNKVMKMYAIKGAEKNKNSIYEELPQNKIIIEANIDNSLNKLVFLSSENYSIVVKWLKKNIKNSKSGNTVKSNTVKSKLPRRKAMLFKICNTRNLSN
jgi:hypothetical protein